MLKLKELLLKFTQELSNCDQAAELVWNGVKKLQSLDIEDERAKEQFVIDVIKIALVSLELKLKKSSLSLFKNYNSLSSDFINHINAGANKLSSSIDWVHKNLSIPDLISLKNEIATQLLCNQNLLLEKSSLSFGAQ